MLLKRPGAGARCGTVASPLLTSRYQTSGTSNSDVVDLAPVRDKDGQVQHCPLVHLTVFNVNVPFQFINVQLSDMRRTQDGSILRHTFVWSWWGKRLLTTCPPFSQFTSFGTSTTCYLLSSSAFIEFLVCVYMMTFFSCASCSNINFSSFHVRVAETSCFLKLMVNVLANSIIFTYIEVRSEIAASLAFFLLISFFIIASHAALTTSSSCWQCLNTDNN